MTRREKIIEYFNSRKGILLSCNDITKHIAEEEKLTGNKRHYLSGSISSILNKLVKDKILGYHVAKTPRGGHLYIKF